MQTTEDKLKTALYLDDMRTPKKTIPGYYPWIIVRSYAEFTNYILRNPMPDLISFDHDLGTEHYTDYQKQFMRMGWQSPDYNSYQEKTGFDCAKFLCSHYQDMIMHLKEEEKHSVIFPKCSVHSSNPVGALNIQSYINGFKKHMKLIPDCWIGQHEFTVEKK